VSENADEPTVTRVLAQSMIALAVVASAAGVVVAQVQQASQVSIIHTTETAELVE
jgi:hypothetical protein